MTEETAEEPTPAAAPVDPQARAEPESGADREGTDERTSPLLPVRAGLAAAAVFVLGLFVGALTVGILGGEPVVVQEAATPQGGDPAAGPSVPAGDAAAQFIVNGDCLGAFNAAQDSLLLVDDVARGAAELDAAALDETVRRLMPLQTRLQSGLEACQVAVEVTGGGTGEEPADPSASPSSSAPAAPTGD